MFDFLIIERNQRPLPIDLHIWYITIWLSDKNYSKKEIIQTNNLSKNEKIQRNNSAKFEKIQRYNLKSAGQIQLDFLISERSVRGGGKSFFFSSRRSWGNLLFTHCLVAVYLLFNYFVPDIWRQNTIELPLQRVFNKT